MITWNGRDENGNLCPSGIYTVKTEINGLNASTVFHNELVLVR